MDKKSKILTVFAFIFLMLTITAFVLSAMMFWAEIDVRMKNENGLGEAVAVALVIIFFIFSEIACAVFAVFSIIFGAVMIKRATGGFRTFFIIDTAASGVMIALAAAMFLYITI